MLCCKKVSYKIQGFSKGKIDGIKLAKKFSKENTK